MQNNILVPVDCIYFYVYTLTPISKRMYSNIQLFNKCLLQTLRTHNNYVESEDSRRIWLDYYFKAMFVIQNLK